MRIISVAVTGIVISAAGASAQAIDKRVEEFLRSSKIRSALASAIQQQTRAMYPDCKDVKIAPGSQFSFVKPIEFGDAPDMPKAGNWIESVKVTTCGSERRHNIQTVIVDGKYKMLAKLNGTSIANVILQRDASALLPAAVKSVAGDGCDKAAVIDTQFKEFEGEPIANAKDGPKSRVWLEDWTVKACDKELLLPIVFTPDQSGTSIAIKSADGKVK